MRVNFLLPHLRISGGVRIALTYASKLAERGHNVTVYVQSSNLVRRTVANILRLGYPTWIPDFSARVIRVPIFSTDTVRDADANVAAMCQSMVVLDSFPPAKGRKYYLVQHDEGLYHAPREIADRALNSNSTKIVVSSWLEEIVRDRYHQEPKLLINPIELSQFREIPRAVNDGTVRILLLHHTYEWKGTAEGVKIVTDLKQRYPQVRLILFGVRKDTKMQIPYDEYHFNLPQNKLAELYSNADIYLCPSWDEGFGLPSIEAMACGMALATYDNGGSRDFAFHEKTALVARRRNVEDLKRQVERLIREPDTRARIAAEGKKFVMGMAGWDERTRQLEEILSR